MPVKESAKKALRQSKKREGRNKKRKDTYKKLQKEILGFLSEGQKEKAEELMSKFQKAVDKAAKTGAIHANKAARLKSQLTKKVKEFTN